MAAAALRPASAWAAPPSIARRQQQTYRGRSESTQLGAVTVVAESDRQFTILPIRDANAQAAWPRRLVKKVLRRERSSLLVDEYSGSTTSDPDAFILDDFADIGPHDLIGRSSATKQSRLITVEEALGADSSFLSPGRSSAPLTRVTASRAETILATLFHRWTNGAHKNLQVHCDSSSGVIDLVKGIFRADATIQFDKLSFGAFRLSRGELKSHRLAINLYKFAPFCKRIPRFASMFDLEARDATFTQDDLFESTCIRHGLRRLLSRCLENRGMSASNVEITSIKIVSTGKLTISGTAMTPFGSTIEFAVRSGLGTSNRGHVLTFPGLEISLSPSLGLFMPVVPPISLDMGHNTQITKLSLNGQDGTLALSCRVTITPRHTRKLKESYEQNTSAYAASFHFDVGRWLTRLGRFSE
ncbi:hypothetical protein ACA910_015972 [Epithemia clementina (nom. ined.)]